MILTGISLLSLLTGVVSGGFFDSIDERKKQVHAEKCRSLIKRAFLMQPTIPERKLVEKLYCGADPIPRKFMSMETALAKLNLSQDDVVAAVRSAKGLRIRELPATAGSRYDSKLVIESFEGNSEYGSKILRGAAFHVISTQSYSDAFVGHFAGVLASALGANYFSNEYFSSGALLPELQINFAKNAAWRGGDSVPAASQLAALRSDLVAVVERGSVAVYIGTAREGTDAFHVALGAGKLTDSTTANVTRPTVSDQARAMQFYKSYAVAVQGLESAHGGDLRVSLQQEYSLESPDHMSRFLHYDCGAEVLTIYVNVGVLRYAATEVYYRAIWLLADCLRLTYPASAGHEGQDSCRFGQELGASASETA
jgi:hypothetical protein